MTRARPYSRLEFTTRFDRSYQRLGAELQQRCDRALEQLLADPIAPGLHLKPIRPSNKFWEARINRGHRIILLPVGGMAYAMDVVTHDEIATWGRAR